MPTNDAQWAWFVFYTGGAAIAWLWFIVVVGELAIPWFNARRILRQLKKDGLW